jgi:hypothetical protein
MKQNFSSCSLIPKNQMDNEISQHKVNLVKAEGLAYMYSCIGIAIVIFSISLPIICTTIYNKDTEHTKHAEHTKHTEQSESLMLCMPIDIIASYHATVKRQPYGQQIKSWDGVMELCQEANQLN